MRAQPLARIFLVTIGIAGAAVGSYAQERPQAHEDPPAPIGIIEGKVRLPSGQPLGTNVKIILSNKQSPLYTLYTNKNGEFRFTDLIEGLYDIEVLPTGSAFESVKQEVRLVRGGQMGLTIYLSTKKQEPARVANSKTVSANELSQNVPAAARKQYEQAWKLIAKGDVSTAIKYLGEALSTYPDYLAARNDLGVQYLKLGRLEEAAEQLNKLIEKNPGYFDPRLNLGLVLVEQRRYSEAIEQLRQAILIDSSRPAAHLWLGVALIQQNELEDAARELLKARLLGAPRYSIARYYLAQIHLKSHRQDEALRELTAYLEESPLGEKSEDARILIEKLKR